MNMIRLCFKICDDTHTIKYEVPGNWTTEYTFHKIRDNLCEDFDIPNTFHIIPGPGLQSTEYTGYAENHPPVEMSENRILSDYCNPNTMNAFYIRIFDELLLRGNDNIQRIMD